MFDERLAGKACRSVHLSYGSHGHAAFLHEMAIAESAPGTYFMAAGWGEGYFGLQELADGKKLALFSVWDSKSNDPKAAAQGSRVKATHQDPKTRIKRFGGEGSGGQSFYDLDWQVGDVWRFLVGAAPKGDRMEFAGWFRDPRAAGWTHMATFSKPGGKLLGGLYCFVEDFRRNGESARQRRRAAYGGGWACEPNGAWAPLAKATFTADNNPARNIDAGVAAGRLFLSTGGATPDHAEKLRQSFALPARAAGSLPADLPAEFLPGRTGKS